jgi:hypothetical protein
LQAASQRRQHRISRIFLAEPNQAGQRTIHLDVQRWLLERLLDACVGNPGNVVDSRQHCVGIGPIRRQIVAHHLQVDRCRCAEIQDLGHHVGWQEGERRAGEQAEGVDRALS